MAEHLGHRPDGGVRVRLARWCRNRRMVHAPFVIFVFVGGGSSPAGFRPRQCRCRSGTMGREEAVPQLAANMSAAFKKVWKIIGTTNPGAFDLVMIRIVELAKDGVHDPEELSRRTQARRSRIARIAISRVHSSPSRPRTRGPAHACRSAFTVFYQVGISVWRAFRRPGQDDSAGRFCRLFFRRPAAPLAASEDRVPPEGAPCPSLESQSRRRPILSSHGQA
jgi:hypothetical protein